MWHQTDRWFSANKSKRRVKTHLAYMLTWKSCSSFSKHVTLNSTYKSCFLRTETSSITASSFYFWYLLCDWRHHWLFDWKKFILNNFDNQWFFKENAKKKEAGSDLSNVKIYYFFWSNLTVNWIFEGFFFFFKLQYFLTFYMPDIIASSNDFYITINHLVKIKKFPEVQSDAIKLLMLFDRQPKTEKYSVYDVDKEEQLIILCLN